MYIFIEHL